MRYAFIKKHEREHSVRRMCKVMQVHPSGFYAWQAEPQSPREQDDRRLLGLLKHAWLESGGTYGYRKLTLDMRDLGERCGKHRVARLLKREGLRSQTGYGRRPGMRGGKPAVVAPNHCSDSFLSPSPTGLGSPTSRTSARTKAGSTWRWSWTCSRGRSSDGRWAAASTPHWSSTRC